MKMWKKNPKDRTTAAEHVPDWLEHKSGFKTQENKHKTLFTWRIIFIFVSHNLYANKDLDFNMK